MSLLSITVEVEDDVRGDEDDSTRLEALLIEMVGKHSASMSEIKEAANQKERYRFTHRKSLSNLAKLPEKNYSEKVDSFNVTQM